MPRKPGAHVPARWILDPRLQKQKTRILAVYEDYIKCRKVTEIAAAHEISIPQVYRDIDKARNELQRVYATEIHDVMAEQVEARRDIISLAREELDRLDEVELKSRTAASIARAKADLLRVISSEFQSIEELLNARNSRGRGPKPGRTPELPASTDDKYEEEGTVVLSISGNSYDNPNVFEGSRPEEIEETPVS